MRFASGGKTKGQGISLVADDRMTASELCLSVIQNHTDVDEPIKYSARRGNVFYFKNPRGESYKVWLSESLSKEFASAVKRNQFIN